MSRWALLAIFMLAAPAAASIPGETGILDDPAGDVEIWSYDVKQTAPGEWNSIDLRSLSLGEDRDSFYIRIGLNGGPSCTGTPCPDGSDTRTYFSYNGVNYMTQMGFNVEAAPYGMLHTWETNRYDTRFVGFYGAAWDAEASTLTMTVPRDAITDESGSPLRGGKSLTKISSEAFSQFSLGGPSPDLSGNQSDMLTTTDKMGFDAPGTYEIQIGGSFSNGDVVMDVEFPFRSSNGGAAYLTYEGSITAAVNRNVAFTARDVPSGWTVTLPEPISISAGQHVTFTVSVETPFGHQHGGSDRFTVHAQDTVDEDTWSQTELGITYLAVPQPAGHHDTVWFHSEPFNAFAATFNPLLSGGDGEVFMNTLEDDENDQHTPIQGIGSFGAGQSYRWAICLDPTLQLGLDFDTEGEGQISVNLGTTKPLTGTRLTGELVVLGPGEPMWLCWPGFYDERDRTVVAKVPPVEVGDLTSSKLVDATLKPTAGGNYVPFKEGQQLVLELTLETTTPTPAGPGGATLGPGGSMRMPLNEYYDERPAGQVGIVIESAPNGTAEQQPASNEKESPTAAIALLTIGILAVASVVGRRNRI